MKYALISCLIGTGFMMFMTSLGSAAVFLFKSAINDKLHNLFLGFAAGVMIAAAVWSLLIPAIEFADSQGKYSWAIVSLGFIAGWLFIFIIDVLLPHLHPGNKNPEGIKSSISRTSMLVLAVTLHNIPEGLAVGLSYGMSINNIAPGGIPSSMALAFGMGLQNFPEGAAISLPLKREGMDSKKAFLIASLSGAVEPIAGVLGVILLNYVSNIMPIMLSFAAGSMIYVVLEELIPQASIGEHSHSGTTGAMIGFVIMMILDVALS